MGGFHHDRATDRVVGRAGDECHESRWPPSMITSSLYRCREFPRSCCRRSSLGVDAVDDIEFGVSRRCRLRGCVMRRSLHCSSRSAELTMKNWVVKGIDPRNANAASLTRTNAPLRSIELFVDLPVCQPWRRAGYRRRSRRLLRKSTARPGVGTITLLGLLVGDAL